MFFQKIKFLTKRQHLTFLHASKTLPLLGGTLLLLVSLPLTLFLAQTRQELRQKAAEPMTTSVTPLGTVYEKDGKVWMENNVFKIGFTLAWGGTISDILLNGVNVINTNNGPGRGIQAAIFDGEQKYDDCSGCTGVFGWNPTQGGDIHNQGSPLEVKSINSNTFYTKTRALEWLPDNKGGGKSVPVASDTIIEQTSTFLPNHPNVLKIHYRITHIGQDNHPVNGQQVPVLTLTKELNTLSYYSGKNPWQNEPLTQISLIAGENTVTKNNLFAPELWTAVSDGRNTIGLYLPGQFPNFRTESFPGDGGPGGVGTNVISPITFFAFTSNRVLENDAYLIFDTPSLIRQTVANLRQEIGSLHPFDPLYVIENPQSYTIIKGSTKINGWAYDSIPIRKIEVLLDGNVAGEATLGIQRLDVLSLWPNFPDNTGYRFFLDTLKYADGTHKLTLRITTEDNKIVESAPRPVIIANDPAASSPVFRLYNRAINNHFYTTGKAEADSVLRYGYQLEGVGFYAYPSSGPNLVPIYRLFHPQKSKHFFTASMTEVDAATRQGFTYEGIAFYAYRTSSSTTVPIYRLRNTRDYGYFYTRSPQERDSILQSTAYILEGIAFYIPDKK